MARQTRRQVRRIRSTGWASALFVALLVLSAAPAFAHHDSDHAQGGGNDNAASDHDGDADSDENTAYTEDNDTNDGGTPNNVPDEGDNQHPSGKDRSVEHGKGGNQGKAESNPDDSKGPQRFEGARGDDKPNGPGGTDLADQDGNNGCGNDDDFDDDNNGWCGKPVKGGGGNVGGGNVGGPSAGGIDRAGGVSVTPQGNESKDRVRGRTDQAVPKTDNVLGKRFSAAAPAVRAGAVLPFTGGSVLAYVAAGLALLFLGALTFVVRPQKR